MSSLVSLTLGRSADDSIVGYFNPAAQRWEYSTKFAVYGTRFLIKVKSPNKAVEKLERTSSMMTKADV
jgi:hypothetical protein